MLEMEFKNFHPPKSLAYLKSGEEKESLIRRVQDQSPPC